MTDLTKLNAKQTAHYGYMADVMARLQWDLHNTIEMTGHIPEEWHEIARKTPECARVKVNLGLDADVVKFFKSMGIGYGPRINAVLKSYMHARLAGVIKGAETTAHHRVRAEKHAEAKPAFGDTARAEGEDWEDEGPGVVIRSKALVVELLQRRYGEEGMPDKDVMDLPKG